MILDMVIVWLDTLSQEAKKDVQMCLIVQNMQNREILVCKLVIDT